MLVSIEGGLKDQPELYSKIFSDLKVGKKVYMVSDIDWTQLISNMFSTPGFDPQVLKNLKHGEFALRSYQQYVDNELNDTSWILSNYDTVILDIQVSENYQTVEELCDIVNNTKNKAVILIKK